MTPLDAARCALDVYSMPPMFGVKGTSGRATAFGADAVAFPGTDNIACWLADLDSECIQVPIFGGIHAGFWESWLEIQPQILALTGIKTLIGHSEGAALALLAAANLCAIGRPPAEVYAFEPPKLTTTDDLAAIFAAHGVEIHLYRNGYDVVPLVPRLLAPWKHPAPLISIGLPKWPFPNVDDHAMGHVLSSIAQKYGVPNDVAHVQV